MADDEAAKRPIYLVKVPGTDEEVEMYAPLEAQIGVLTRVSHTMQSLRGKEAGADVARQLGLIYRITESLFVHEEDRDWVDGLMVEGKVSASDGLGLALDAMREHLETVKAAQAPSAGPVRRVASAGRTKK